MHAAQTCLVVSLAAAVLSGCQPSPLEAYDRYDLGPARDIVCASVQAMGGLDYWRNVGNLRSDAVLTFYEDGGHAHVTHVTLTVDLWAESLTAEGQTPTGHWSARLSRGGSFRLSHAAALDQVTPEMLREGLGLLLARIGGPLRLLSKHQRVTRVENVWMDGLDLVRVDAETETGLLAYFFAADGGMLKRVAAGLDRPRKEVNVTLYTYQMLDNGVLFPKTVHMVRAGRHVLVGPSSILSAEFSNVHVE